MTKIVFNYNGLKSAVVPNLDDAINQLEAATRLSSNMRIPSDFSHSGYLRELKSTLTRHKKEVADINKWLENTNSKLESTLNNIDSNLSNIQRTVIMKRENAVNKS